MKYLVSMILVVLMNAKEIHPESSSLEDIQKAAYQCSDGDTLFVLVYGDTTWPSPLIITKKINIVGTGGGKLSQPKEKPNCPTVRTIKKEPCLPKNDASFDQMRYGQEGSRTIRRNVIDLR